MKTNSPTQPATLLRRLGAIFYDTLVTAGLLMVAGGLSLLFTDGEAVNAGNPLYSFYLVAVVWAFFGWFWTHGGQTVGMRAWRIRVQTKDGYQLNWAKATIRFFAALLSWACVGLGFLWSVFDAEKRTWHDRLSGTVTIHQPR